MITPFTNRSQKGLLSLLAFACFSALMATAAKAQITTVFYVLLENRCFTSGTDTSQANILFQNKLGASPYITSLCTPGGMNTVTGLVNPATAQSSFCSAYHNANSQTTGDYLPSNNGVGGSVHPSEPQYVWMEAGSNLSKYDDNDPYGSGASVAQIASFLASHPTYTGENLSGLLQNAGISWTSYTEGTMLQDSSGGDYNQTRTAGGLTNTPVALGLRSVPLVSFSGASANYVNAYNGTGQYNFATKHTGSLFFPATNGSTSSVANNSTSNPEVSHYRAMEQFAGDLSGNTQAQYVVITPDQYNDGHTALPSTIFTYNGTQYGSGKTGGTDLERVAQMDSYCSLIVPQIMASPVYQAGHAAIVIWTDETEGGDDYYHTLTEIVISPFSKGNAYNSTMNYTHSADVATFQKVFQVVANTPSGYLNDAANPSVPTVGTAIINSGQGLQNSTGQPFFGFGTGQAQDLSDLFVPGTIPASLQTVTLTPSGYAFNRHTGLYTQTVTVTNGTSGTINTPIYLAVGGLANGATLSNKTGVTASSHTADNPPVAIGTPYISVGSTLAAGASTTVTLQYTAPTSGGLNTTLTALETATAP